LPSRLPLACELLRFGDLRGGHTQCDHVSVFYRILISLRRRQVKPHVRADIVLQHAQAFEVKDPEIVLGGGDALVRSEAISLHSLSIVLLRATAGGEHEAEIKLGGGVALVRSEEIP